MKLKMRRHWCLIIASLATFLMLTVPVEAALQKERLFPTYTGSQVILQTSIATLYDYPSAYSDTMEIADTSKLYILGSNDAWYRVRAGNKEGWIRKESIKVPKDTFIPYSKVKGEEVVEYGKQFLGTPYVWGGNDLKKGVDCSGLTKGVYAGFDIKLSRLSYLQAADGKPIPKEQLRPGDLVFFDTSDEHNGQISHVGIYVGEDQFLHADCTKGVTISRLSSHYYLKNYVTSSRILEDNE